MIKQEIVAKLLKNGRFYAKRKCLRVSVLFYILGSKERVKELPLTALKNTLNINKLNDYFRLLTAEKKKIRGIGISVNTFNYRYGANVLINSYHVINKSLKYTIR